MAFVPLAQYQLGEKGKQLCCHFKVSDLTNFLKESWEATVRASDLEMGPKLQPGAGDRMPHDTPEHRNQREHRNFQISQFGNKTKLCS